MQLDCTDMESLFCKLESHFVNSQNLESLFVESANLLCNSIQGQNYFKIVETDISCKICSFRFPRHNKCTGKLQVTSFCSSTLQKFGQLHPLVISNMFTDTTPDSKVLQAPNECVSRKRFGDNDGV